jgi:hypothetical protein
MVIVDPIAMKKRFDPETDVTLIDPGLKWLWCKRSQNCQ